MRHRPDEVRRRAGGFEVLGIFIRQFLQVRRRAGGYSNVDFHWDTTVSTSTKILLPLFLAIPAVLPTAFLFQVVSGGFFCPVGLPELAEKLGLVVSALWAATYWLTVTYVHEPATGMEVFRLVLAALFIAGVVACLIVAVGALSVGIGEYWRSKKIH